ncbi:hypothetical protein BBK82_04530 [Lentzea guizhouensis]|uniref:Uncharacterized protein n=1 Tax=Lentzea guizhouensis TaxID=1586287 RepID=A0A1B2HCJ7_9PSEU|nr:hypothetical protein [Lentzea guizhouensis]ANZ35454.1 hypothetical protein BBK82_04530 [Lentzea guizhouensis]
MPITFDTTGFQQLDQHTWLHGGGDRLALTVYDGPADLPVGLDDLPGLRRELAVRYAPTGCLVEAQVVQLGDVPALLQIAKMPLGNRPGQAFGLSLTVQGVNAHAVLSLVAEERGTTGMREGVLAAEIGFQRWVLPHPYAPQLQSKLPFHAGDDPRFDSRFPDHPLSRVRRLVHQLVGTARVDPAFVAPPQPELPPEVDAMFHSQLTTAECGFPVNGHIALQVGERTTYWKLLDEAVPHRLGRGTLGRSPHGDARFREVLMVDERTGTALMMDRFMTDGASLGVQTTLQPVSRDEAYAAVTPEALAEAYRGLGRLADMANGRNEYLTIEPITHQAGRSEPFAMLGVQHHEGEDIVLVSCSPAPSQNTPFKGSPGINAVITPETLRGIGELAMQAMLEWGPHPLDMAVTFHRYDGTTEAQATPESVTDEVRAQFSGQLAKAVPGMVIGGHVAVQQGEQRTYWRLPDEELSGRLGLGVLTRDHSPGHRFRDVVLLDRQSGELLVPNRYGDTTTGTKSVLTQVSAEEAMAAATPEACEEAFERLGRCVYSAAKRGEFLFVELVENELKQDPHVLLAVLGFFDDEPVAVASASPAPSANTRFNGLPTLEGPATPQTVAGLGALALQAITDWGVHPLHVVPTYHRPTR